MMACVTCHYASLYVESIADLMCHKREISHAMQYSLTSIYITVCTYVCLVGRFILKDTLCRQLQCYMDVAGRTLAHEDCKLLKR